MMMMVMIIIITTCIITIIIQVHHDKECPAYPVVCKKCNKDEIPRAKVIILIHCEQSFSFSRFSKGCARARERRRVTRGARAAAHEEKRETAHIARANGRCVGVNAKYDWLMREALTTNCQ